MGLGLIGTQGFLQGMHVGADLFLMFPYIDITLLTQFCTITTIARCPTHAQPFDKCLVPFDQTIEMLIFLLSFIVIQRRLFSLLVLRVETGGRSLSLFSTFASFYYRIVIWEGKNLQEDEKNVIFNIV